MVLIRGRVDPERALNGNGRWRHLMGKGRWKLDYTVLDAFGEVMETGTLKADLSGRFVLAIEAPAPGSVKIAVRGRDSSARDSCTVHVYTSSDVVNLPRTLYPCNGHSSGNGREAGEKLL